MKTLKLETGAFTQELHRLIPADKIGWPNDDHGHLVDALLNRLQNEGNEKVTLNDAHRDIMKLILRPTEELQRRVLKQVVASVGYELDANTETVFASLFDAVGFGVYLSKKINSKTGKPYIKKATKTAKKDALDALMDQEVEPVKTETATAPVAAEITALAPVQPPKIDDNAAPDGK